MPERQSSPCGGVAIMGYLMSGGNRQIPCFTDFLDAFHDRRHPRYLANCSGFVLAHAVPCLENPCVGGSIPPRATKNIPHETPTHAGWRFCLWTVQSSCPVYFRLNQPSSSIQMNCGIQLSSTSVRFNPRARSWESLLSLGSETAIVSLVIILRSLSLIHI